MCIKPTILRSWEGELTRVKDAERIQQLSLTAWADANDYSIWVLRDGYPNSNVVTLLQGQSWDDYSTWIQQDKYYESNIVVSASDEDWDTSTLDVYPMFKISASSGDECWDDYSAWSRLDQYFEFSYVNVSTNGEDWDDYSSWTQQDSYFTANVECNATGENWDDYLCWTEHDRYFESIICARQGPGKAVTCSNLEEGSSSWIEDEISHQVAMEDWNHYSYWTSQDTYFSLDMGPFFNDESWDDYSYWSHMDAYFSYGSWPIFVDESWGDKSSKSHPPNSTNEDWKLCQTSEPVATELTTLESGFVPLDPKSDELYNTKLRKPVLFRPPAIRIEPRYFVPCR